VGVELSSVWPGFGRKGSVVIPIPHSAWPPPTSPVDGFQPKQELHLTIMGKERALPFLSHEKKLRAAFESLRWEIERTGERLQIRKLKPDVGLVESIIERVRCDAMAAFYRLLDLDDVQPPHVTLYTKGDPEGIGIPTEAALQSMLVTRLR